MSNDKIYYIPVNNQLIIVSYEVYQAYYKSKEQEKYQEKKKRNYEVLSYHALDSSEFNGEDIIWDRLAPTPEEIVISHVTSAQLNSAIETLSEEEYNLVQALFFEGSSLRMLARKSGVPLNSLKYQRDKVLRKLKKYLEN
ncbi:hypothetical protein RFF05_00375 [Bengtsoniella intestinalis]|uniref:RNA polymerase sigma factor n=1 Tax=Bengtsoniella intestinalis TaxID=3073143 RepID=UPI00391F7408